MFDPKSQHSYSFNSPLTHKNGNYDNFGSRDHSTTIKKPARNLENYTRVNDPDIQLRAQNIDDETDSTSPPLWKSSSPKNPGNLSPNSRSRAIAKGQKELMEMARNMPESCYELSLRDMVESPIVESPKLDDDERCLVDGKNRKSVKESVKRQESKKVEKRIERVRSSNLESSGLFLKLNFPFTFRYFKEKNNMAMRNSKRIAPKVGTLGKSSSEKDWWKKKFSGSSGSDSSKSGVASSNSGSSKSTTSSNDSSNIQKSKGWSSGCWSFAFSRKKKRKER